MCFHTRGWVARWKRETGNCSPTRDARDQVGNGKWEIGFGCVEKAKWEIGSGKLPSGKLDVMELPAFGKRETGNWLLNLPRRDILQSTVEGFRSIKTEPFEGCENIVKIGFVRCSRDRGWHFPQGVQAADISHFPLPISTQHYLTTCDMVKCVAIFPRAISHCYSCQYLGIWHTVSA